MPRVTTTHRIAGEPGEPVTVAELREFIEGLPDDARITVEMSPDHLDDDERVVGPWYLTASELPRVRPAKLPYTGLRSTAAAVPLPATMGPDEPPVPVWAQEGFTKQA